MTSCLKNSIKNLGDLSFLVSGAAIIPALHLGAPETGPLLSDHKYEHSCICTWHVNA